MSYFNVLKALQPVLMNAIIRFSCLDSPVGKVTREGVLQ